ncbi:MAG: hypothetical protein HGB10_04850 [Coriobacteriia bacterium]|nr:hypothetical protein [Coriobacteriia bacterium]
MNMKRMTAAVAGALVAGLVLGTAVSGYAATTGQSGTASTVAAACGTAGLRLGGAVRDGGGRLLDVVSKLTGMSTAEVTAERAAGKTFTQIAAAKNVDSSAVIAEALKVRESLLAEKVAAGTITQAQADTALENMKARVTSRVDTVNADCDGTGSGSGGGSGAGKGGGNGGGGRGNGAGGGRGAGGGDGTGTCTVQ